MGENDMQQMVGLVTWFDATVTIHRFLEANELAHVITDGDLVDLMTACGNARQRLREKSGG